MDSDEEETFISIGNPVEQLDPDEPLKKPVQELTVKDKRGKQRFHGAFTGGFSAGYFNSVGTKDGFAPSEFVSSRDSKISSIRQRPEDFMDEEDFSEHGIAPRKLVTSETFSTEERKKRRHEEGKALMTGTVFEGTSSLTDFILPEKLTIGLKLLKKLGWKQGHGIGSRKASENAPAQKVYGCSLPSQSTNEDSDEEIQLGPKDVNPISFDAKDNVHGLGYSGLNPRSALPGSHINLFEPPAITKTGRKGIRGQAFGVGALEDDDEDIYRTDHMSNYDMTMEIEDSSNLHGWTAPKTRHEPKHLPVGYVGKVLEGFNLSDTLNRRKVFPPPDLPRHFKPRHVFLKPSDSESDTKVMKDSKLREQSAITRGLALGEIESVFDLVPSKDKEKMKTVRREGVTATVIAEKSLMSSSSTHQPIRHIATNEPPGQQLVPVQKDCGQSQHLTSEPEAERNNNPLFLGGSLSFKPFIKNENKQHRYEKYLALLRHGNKDAYEEVTEGHMTEWEKEREKEEFIKAAKMYKPLSGMIASRFTRAKFEDSVDTVDVPAEPGGDKDDRQKAADMKMYGKLTRDEFEWHPDRLLCRRFNVPDPYPGSSIVGLPTVKRDKYSVYNFLTFPSDETSHAESSETVENKEELHVSSQDVDRSSQRHEKPTKTSDHKEVAASSKPISIFSHLVEPERKTKSESNFTKTKHAETTKSILSHLVDAENSIKERRHEKGMDIDVDKKKISPESSVEKKTDEEKPPMDLFSAIFGNTDSEDSDEEEDNNVVQTDIISSALNSEKETSKEPQFLPGAAVAIETIEERLSPKIPDNYGPAPPTTSAFPTSSTSTGSLVSSRDYVESRRRDKCDMTSVQYTEKTLDTKHENTHRKHSKHKQKKEKKSKHKKSKHKKKEKKKKRRYSDSEDDSSREEDDIPTDKELLQKLKSLPKGKYQL